MSLPAIRPVLAPAPAPSPSPRAVDMLLAQLEAEGVTHIFGVPGGNLLPLYEALSERGTIRSILCKHEEGGAFMADGFARVSHTLGVCCGIAGPGATHALTGVAGAFADSIPLLFLSGQVATSVFGRGAIQDSTALGIDLVAMFKPVTKLSTMLVNAETAPRLVQQAIRTALSGRPGPVHLNLPGDVSKTRLSPGTLQPPPVHHASQPCDMLEAARAAALLARARSPAILAGNGVNLVGAWDELRALAERAGIPVATTPKAKGAFPENHPLSLGVFGFGGHQRASRYLSGEVDVLLVVGSSLGEFQTNAWDVRFAPTETLIQVDIDPREIGKNYRADVALVADARTALSAIEAQMSKMLVPLRADPMPPHLAEIPRYVEAARMEDDSNPIKPQRVVAELRRALPDDALVFVDIGNCISWMEQYFEVREPGTFFLNLGLACMGWSIPASIGGQLASPDRRVVGVLGDGAFAMMGMEIHTAVEHALPIVWVVLNDAGYGMVDHGERLRTGRPTCPARFTQRIDAAAIAEALGARGLHVDRADQLEGTLREALRGGRPTVVDVRIDPNEIPGTLRMRTESLARMFETGSR